MATYKNTSPYHTTTIRDGQYLDLLSIRPVPASDDDQLYVIQPQYAYRPDLLAYDLYGSKDLWWVFAQRNMNVLKDPVNDLVAGVEIYLPNQNYLSAQLGL